MCRRRKVKKDPAAAIAVIEATESLKRVKSRDPEVHRVAEASKEFRRKNHFSEQLSELFVSHPRPRKEHP